MNECKKCVQGIVMCCYNCHRWKLCGLCITGWNWCWCYHCCVLDGCSCLLWK